MALHNILGLLFPLGAALAIGKCPHPRITDLLLTISFSGALAVGLFYRDRARELRHDFNDDTFTSDFHPEPGFDTRAPSHSTAEEEEKCCICLEGIRRFQNIRTLRCAHKFHKKCVDNWLRYEMFCPNCRTVVSS